MEFRQLKTFRAVADLLNFTKAADQLHLAQSSVSAQIRALEDELGVRLFDRIGRRILLTNAGERLLDYARRIEDMDDEIRAEVSGASEPRGRLTVRVPESLAEVYMPRITEAFLKENPKVRLDYINCTDMKLREELNSGRIDLAFLMIDSVKFGDVNLRLLRTEALTMVAGPTHPLAKKKKMRPSDLEGELVLLSHTD